MNVLKAEFICSIPAVGGDWYGCVYISKTILRTFHTDVVAQICVFHSSPSSSRVWLALIDTTCTFHILCACYTVGRDQGSVWAHPLALPQAVVLVMQVHLKHEHAKYLSLIQTFMISQLKNVTTIISKCFWFSSAGSDLVFTLCRFLHPKPKTWHIPLVIALYLSQRDTDRPYWL